MKTTALAVTALLASIAFAQPYHGRHLHKKDLHKRKYVTEVVTKTETATLIIDQDGTSLIEPTPAQFYPSTTSEETTSTTTSTSTTSTSTSTSEPTTSISTTSTSTYVQPQPTTTTTPPPAQETTPTTTSEAPAYTQTTQTTYEAAAPTSGSGSGSSGGGSGYSGDITFYTIGMGSCGIDVTGQKPNGTSPSNPAVVALSYVQMEISGNPNLNPLCGKLIKITANGKTGYGKVLDMCEGCQSGSIDVNQEAFANFYDPSLGRKPCTWEFM